MKIGYHASHEQFTPSELLEFTRAAERAGFNAAMCSDHFHPWSRQHGQSAFAWSWLGPALQATELPFGVVCAPGQRYHPAVIAQAVATLLQMYPGRFWMAVGSGQVLNEGITGGEWPMKSVRNERLRESVYVMRELWQGKKVSHHGHVRVEEAKLYTLPEETPRVIAAALTPETAEWAGGWADGLITVSKPRKPLQSMVDAWRRGAGKGKPMYLQVKLSYADTDQAALEGAFDEWRYSLLESHVETALRSPEAFEAASVFVKPEDMRDFVRVSSRLEDHCRWLQEDLDMGFEELYLHNVNRRQRQFIDDFGNGVLPELLRGATRP